MKKQFIYFALIAVFASVFASCSNDDDVQPEPDNEEEEITTVKVTATTGGESKTFTYKVIDNVTTKDDIKLMPNTTYTVKLEFLNEAENPAEDVTEEITEESDEHLICFTASGASITTTRTDRDANNKEIGLTSTWTTGAAGSGTMNITLKHQPDLKKDNAGVNCDLGETDISVNFTTQIL